MGENRGADSVVVGCNDDPSATGDSWASHIYIYDTPIEYYEVPTGT